MKNPDRLLRQYRPSKEMQLKDVPEGKFYCCFERAESFHNTKVVDIIFFLPPQLFLSADPLMIGVAV